MTASYFVIKNLIQTPAWNSGQGHQLNPTSASLAATATIGDSVVVETA